MTLRDLRIAVWQCAPLPLDVEANLRRIERQAAEARGQGADLLVCPEMMLTGYAIGVDAIERRAEPADGPSARRLAAATGRLGIAIAYGYPERGADGRIHNSAQLLGGGQAIGHCRKTHLFGELDRESFAPGEGLEPPGTLHGWRIGLAICYDIEFPETARRLAVAGADLVVVPTANMVEFDAAPRLLVPARALENQLFVAYANYCGADAALRYGGLSGVHAPDGEAPWQAGREETLLVADLGRDRLAASRQRFPYLRDLLAAR